MKYGQGPGNGQWGSGRKAGCGGSEDIAGGEAQGFFLYLIKAGLLPVRFVLYLIKAGFLPVRFFLYLIKAGLLPVRFILYLTKAGLLPVRFILYLIRAGLLPVRFRPPIAGAVGASRAARQAARCSIRCSIGEEAIVPDPHEALGNVEEKPTDELLDREAITLVLFPCA